MISPVLSYNNEIWCVHVKHDFKAWDNTPVEKTHLKFCKRYLEISNTASNVASRSELGRLPLIININIYKNILYYVLYLLRKNEDTIVKQAISYLARTSPGGVRTTIAKHHGRYSKSDHLCQDGVLPACRRLLFPTKEIGDVCTQARWRGVNISNCGVNIR